MDYRKITGESTKDEKKRSVGLMDKIKLNELEYKSPLYQAPVSLRNVRQFPFAQSSYNAGQTMLANLQTSSFYLDGRNSRLEFVLEFSGTAAEKVGLGQGSALNVIRSVVLTSRSGTEISRLNSVNLFAAKTHRFTKSKDWFDTEGTLVGYHQEHLTIAAGGTISHKFAIPLPMISGFFAPLNGQYLPPYVCSGLRVEIQLASATEALQRISGSNTVSYRIVDPVLVCDLVKMSDKVDQVMTSVAHKAGLDIVFDEYDTFSVVTSSQKNTIDISKTASKAEKIIVCSRTADNVSDITEDRMRSENYAVNEYQARVGSVYHPQTAITEKVSAYANALQLFKGMRKDERSYPYASLGTFSLHGTNPVTNLVEGGYAVLGTNLSRSSLIDSQCVPLNNSHSLSLSIGFNSAEDREITAFLVYKKVCKAFTNNAIIYE